MNMNLPNEYINEMKSLLGEEQYRLYEKSLNEDRKIGIRINTKKISVDDFIKVSPFSIKRIPYVDNGFWVDDNENVSKHPFYYAGLYYIQEPSAMIPAACLNIKKEDYVLDLCAAPGGKATEILSKNPAFILANDLSYSRTIPLVKNMEMFGGKNYMVSADKPQKLERFFPSFFDKIIVDAPCSGEGMFRKDPSLITSWNKKRPFDYNKDQYEILSSAVKMLKPGGLIIYSTCTFSICEDEDIVGRILEENPDVQLIELPKYDGFSDGYNSSQYPHLNFSKCIRIFPHLLKGEGHFVAGIYKNRAETNDVKTTISKCKIKFLTENQLPDKCKEFLNHVSSDFKSGKYYINNGFLYVIDEIASNILNDSLHYTRTGCLIGQIKEKGNFSVNSGLALSLTINQFDNVLNLNINDERVLKYLKCETILNNDSDPLVKKGYVLVCVNGFPLGFAKFDGTKYKNLYVQGWRYNGN